MSPSQHIRRLVTTVDGRGKAVALFDSHNPHRTERAKRRAA
ncbi:MAG TPA: hypothetical protein VH684_29095 [Xanthobacteraceae bacterium]